MNHSPNSLTYNELEELIGTETLVWDARYNEMVKISGYGNCYICYHNANYRGEIYRGDETGRFFIEKLKD